MVTRHRDDKDGDATGIVLTSRTLFPTMQPKTVEVICIAFVEQLRRGSLIGRKS
jgi:hypothetical protein